MDAGTLEPGLNDNQSAQDKHLFEQTQFTQHSNNDLIIKTDNIYIDEASRAGGANLTIDQGSAISVTSPLNKNTTIESNTLLAPAASESEKKPKSPCCSCSILDRLKFYYTISGKLLTYKRDDLVDEEVEAGKPNRYR